MGLWGRDGPGDVEALELIEGLLLSPVPVETEAVCSAVGAVSKEERDKAVKKVTCRDTR